MWFVLCFFSHWPPILKVKVVNFEFIKVTRYVEEKSALPVHPDPGSFFKVFKELFWLQFYKQMLQNLGQIYSFLGCF